METLWIVVLHVPTAFNLLMVNEGVSVDRTRFQRSPVREVKAAS